MVEPEPVRRSSASKILSLDDLEATVSGWHDDGLQVVHCHGVFDLLHPGHIKHFEAARQQGNRLIVTLTPDQFVNKGPGRPVFNSDLRAHSLAVMEIIDAVAVNLWQTATETITKLKPDVYVKGNDYADLDEDATGKIVEEKTAIEAVGGRLHITDEETFSSSNLINNFIDIYPKETEAWLSDFRNDHAEEQIFEYFDKIADLNVLVIGEVIVDEYVFCEGLGKSSKDPILAFQDRGMERYAGGAAAIANHLSTFCKNVSVVSIVGDLDGKNEFIQKSLGDNLKSEFFPRDGAPTITKRRFVDTHTQAKLMEIYEMAETVIPESTEKRILDYLAANISDFDVVIVADYGHGMMTSDIIEFLCAQAKFLAVNTQHNAGNRGFNTITRYRSANYICMNGQEAAIETRLRNVSPSIQISRLADMIDCPNIMITLGSDGSLFFDASNEYFSGPALAVQVVDRVGSGDAVLALSAPLIQAGMPGDIVSFVGNVVGAEVIGRLGSGTRLDRDGLQNHLRSLMK